MSGVPISGSHDSTGVFGFAELPGTTPRIFAMTLQP